MLSTVDIIDLVVYSLVFCLIIPWITAIGVLSVKIRTLLGKKEKTGARNLLIFLLIVVLKIVLLVIMTAVNISKTLLKLAIVEQPLDAAEEAKNDAIAKTSAVLYLIVLTIGSIVFILMYILLTYLVYSMVLVCKVVEAMSSRATPIVQYMAVGGTSTLQFFYAVIFVTFLVLRVINASLGNSTLDIISMAFGIICYLIMGINVVFLALLLILCAARLAQRAKSMPDVSQDKIRRVIIILLVLTLISFIILISQIFGAIGSVIGTFTYVPQLSYVVASVADLVFTGMLIVVHGHLQHVTKMFKSVARKKSEAVIDTPTTGKLETV